MKNSQVALIVDREFGSCVNQLLKNCAIWIVDTPINNPVITKNFQLINITSFKDNNQLPSSDLAANMIDIIIEHFNVDLLSEFLIIGTLPTPLMTDLLAEYNFFLEHSTAEYLAFKKK